MDLRASIANQTDVGLGITKQLLQTQGKDKNVVYSPLSIHVVLSLIAAGSKGPTQEQLLSFLKSKFAGDLNSFASELVAVIFSDGSPSGGPRLSFANGIWVDKPLPLKPSFKQVVETAYNAALNQVDFQTKVSAFHPSPHLHFDHCQWKIGENIQLICSKVFLGSFLLASISHYLSQYSIALSFCLRCNSITLFEFVHSIGSSSDFF